LEGCVLCVVDLFREDLTCRIVLYITGYKVYRCACKFWDVVVWGNEDSLDDCMDIRLCGLFEAEAYSKVPSSFEQNETFASKLNSGAPIKH
jgi:hypothetical protein